MINTDEFHEPFRYALFLFLRTSVVPMLRRLAANPNTSCPFMLSHVFPYNGWSIHIKFSMDLTRTEWSAAIFGGFENPRWTSLHSCLRRCRRCQGGLRWRRQSQDWHFDVLSATFSWWYCYGQNPASPRRMIIPLFISHRVLTCFNHPRWCRISSIKSSCCGSWGMS